MKTVNNTMRWAAIAVFSALPFVVPAMDEAPATEEEIQFSEAETRMWMTDQLASVGEPMTITYHFERSGSYERGFEDVVEFRISEVKDDGLKAASVNFFTGERQFPIPPVENTDKNPVLGIYLQGDVLELNRLTDERGTAKERWRYFHRQIKHALSRGADVTPTTVMFDGKEYAGHRIEFSPFVNDPHRDEFAKFADKKYMVVLSDEIPGYLFEIRTVVPGEGKDFDNPLIVEQLRLQSAQPLDSNS